jgi:amicyanin
MLAMTRVVLAAMIVAAPFITPAYADNAAVKISNFTFEPKELHIKAGTKVTWTNEDDIPHTVVSPPQIRSQPLDTDQAYSFTFARPGTYKYFCSLHPHMTGLVVVEAATDSNPKP